MLWWIQNISNLHKISISGESKFTKIADTTFFLAANEQKIRNLKRGKTNTEYQPSKNELLLFLFYFQKQKL